MAGWVGDSNGPGIAQGILSIPERLDWYCLLAGLDFVNINLIPVSPSEQNATQRAFTWELDGISIHFWKAGTYFCQGTMLTV
jgi:hypothetical protein